MERSMGEQVNKAFEVYRQASLEKELAKKELEKMTEYYVRYTQELQQRIEDQRQLITSLEAQLASANQPPGETRCQPRRRGARAREEGPEGPEGAELRVHRSDRTADLRKTQQQKETADSAVAVPPPLPLKSPLDSQSMLEVFEAIQGKFQQIQILTRRQKAHLRRFQGRDPSSDQQFSMPIQCTDGTAERPEGPALPAPRASGATPRTTAGATPGAMSGAIAGAMSGAMTGTTAGAASGAPPAGGDTLESAMALASRGAGPQDLGGRDLGGRDLADSLARLSVKFPPALDCEYDFLNSAPERRLPPAMQRPLRCGQPPLPVTEEPPPGGRAGPSFGLTPRPPSLTEEGGPQLPIWGPVHRELDREAPERGGLDRGGRERGGGSGGGGSSSSPQCAFCQATVPQENMNSHLYLHFTPKNSSK